MKKLIYILFILLLTACSDDLNSPLAEDKGTPMKFEAVVIDAPQSRGQVLDVYNNDITRDFKAGDSFGLFILDGSNNFVTLIDGNNAKNIKLTTPEGLEPELRHKRSGAQTRLQVRGLLPLL